MSLKKQKIKSYQNNIILLALLFFLFNETVLFAYEIEMKCKNYKYKYISENGAKKVYSSSLKRDKGEYHLWCPTSLTERNSKFMKSITNASLVISDEKAICTVEKYVMKNGGVGKNQTSVNDFAKLERTTEYYWNDNPKKIVKKEKCKLIK